MLCTELENHQYLTKIAKSDADCLIVQTALNFNAENKNNWFIGEDMDSLVILHERVKSNRKVFLLEPGKDSADNKICSFHSFKHENINSSIGFIPAILHHPSIEKVNRD